MATTAERAGLLVVGTFKSGAYAAQSPFLKRHLRRDKTFPRRHVVDELGTQTLLG